MFQGRLRVKSRLDPFFPVIPIVLYHGKEAWKPVSLKSCFNDLPAELISFVPEFNYCFINLSNYSNQEIKGEIFTAALLKSSLLIFKNIFYPEKLEKSLNDFFKIGEKCFKEEKSLKFLEIVIKYIYLTTEIKISKVVEAIEPITEKGGEIAMTTAEKLRQEGMQRGMQQGMQKGTRKGTYNTYFNLIQNMKKNNISETEIAKLMNLEIRVIKKIANKEEVEIPLYLLDSDL